MIGRGMTPNFPHVIDVRLVCAEEAASLARAMFEAGHEIDDCPYPEDSNAAIAWRRAFIACERDGDEQE